MIGSGGCSEFSFHTYHNADHLIFGGWQDDVVKKLQCGMKGTTVPCHPTVMCPLGNHGPSD